MDHIALLQKKLSQNLGCHGQYSIAELARRTGIMSYLARRSNVLSDLATTTSKCGINEDIGR